MSEFFRKSLYRPSAPSLLQVKRIHETSPGLRAITFTGEGLKKFPAYCPAAHVKLFLPRDGQEHPTLPTLGPSGPVWPSGELKPIIRTYSVRGFRPDALEIDIEFAIHGVEGPATKFARQAKPGDSIGVSYPGGPDPMFPAASRFVLAGDTAALPALASILEHLPPTTAGDVFIRVDQADDVRDLSRPTGVHLHWFVDAPENIHELVEAFKNAAFTTTDTFYWIGGEHSLVVSLRKYLARELGVTKDAIYALPYWRHNLDEEGYSETRDAVMNEDAAQ